MLYNINGGGYTQRIDFSKLWAVGYQIGPQYDGAYIHTTVLFDFGQAGTDATITTSPSSVCEGWYFKNGFWYSYAYNGTTLITSSAIADMSNFLGTTTGGSDASQVLFTHAPGTGMTLQARDMNITTGFATLGTGANPGTSNLQGGNYYANFALINDGTAESTGAFIMSILTQNQQGL